MDYRTSISACVWIFTGNALNGLSYLTCICHVLLCIPFHIFYPLINLTEAPNAMGFPSPQLPHLLFYYDSFFYSSFFLQHNHDFVHVLPLIPALSLVPAHPPVTKVTERFWGCSVAYGVCLSRLQEKFHLGTFSWCELSQLCCPSVELWWNIPGKDLVVLTYFFRYCIFRTPVLGYSWSEKL